MRWLRWSPLLLLLTVPALAQAATTHEATAGATGLSYAPNPIPITVGDSVHWTHAGAAIQHDVHIVGEASGLTAPKTSGDLGTRQFNVDNVEITYYCDIHGSPTSGMRGTIIVGTPAQPSPEPSPSPTPGSSPVAGSTPTVTATASTTPQPGVTPTVTAAAGVTPTATAGVTPAAPTAKLSKVKLKRGKVRGSATVKPAGKAYTVTVTRKGKRLGRVKRTATGKAQAFAIKVARKPGKLTVTVRAGSARAKRTLTVK